MKHQRRAASTATMVAIIVFAVVIAGSLWAYSMKPPSPSPGYSSTPATTASCVVTSTNGLGQKSTYTCASQTSVSLNSTAGDTYLTRCSVTGVGGFQLRIVFDSTRAAVSGETINATDILGCDIVGQAAETQVVYLDNFSPGQGGWLTPVFPAQAEPGGELNFTVMYEGATFHFSAAVPPIGTSCVTLGVPSGNVTRTAIMNGTCSSTSSVSSEEYNVTFQQVGAGACPFLGEPWAVTIGNTTEVRPVGTTLPLNDGGPVQGTNDTNISTISFSLPPGTYQYQVHPSFEFFTPSSGTLNVTATSSITVNIAYTGHGCITTSKK